MDLVFILALFALGCFIYGLERKSTIFLIIAAIFFIIAGIQLYDVGLTNGNWVVNINGLDSNAAVSDMNMVYVNASNNTTVWAMANFFILGGIMIAVFVLFMQVINLRRSGKTTEFDV